MARAIDEFLGDRASDRERSRERPDAPALPLGPNAFVREGEYWTLAFDGALCRLRDTKGLRHLAHLLRHPGEPIAAAELAAELATPTVAVAGYEAGPRGAASGLGDAGPVLDRAARRQYQRRLADLQEELAEAERFGDYGRIERTRTEIDVLTVELAAAVGLGGRDRRVASAAERARLTVTKRIKDALANIRARHPALGRHLADAVKTGHFYVYSPADPVSWSL